MAEPNAKRKFLTDPEKFTDVSRGNPKPFTLKGDDLAKARMTAETWRLEVVSDGSAKLEKQLKLDDGTALDMPALLELGKTHGIKYLKAMQCSNIAQPLGEGLWEGVPLREIVKLTGKMSNIRRLYFHGFHNNDPKQLFQSSLCMNQVLETPPWDLPPLVAYQLNGQPISLLRGGPVRMLVPWAHGFKSIKWLQKITLTNNHQANDTYANGNNDVDSYLKTMARIDTGSEAFKLGDPIHLSGLAMVGWSGLKRVEYWLRPDAGTHGKLDDDDPAWKTAKWLPCAIDPPPDEWGGQLPDGVMPKDVWGFDPMTGKPKDWPLRFSWAQWSVTIQDVPSGVYEFRVRSVDLNGFAQPEPRPYQKSGQNPIQYKPIMVMK
jgi:DMSO/TMAO reductase YedYZ molybdopterin-dependent catalytic subunit